MVPTTAVDAAARPRRMIVTQWVVFACSGVRYGVPLEHVTGIFEPLRYTRMPGANAGVAGLAGLRGRILTVFDGGVVLGHAASASRPEHRVLVLDAAGRMAGLAVDEVRSVSTAVPEPGAATAAPVWLTGGARDEEGAFVVLDAAHLLDAMFGG